MSDVRVKLAVVIINFKTPDLVIQCLSSFLNQFDGINGKVAVVDNGSRDGSAAQIRSWLAAHDDAEVVRMVESVSNVGFSGGNNIGIRAINADYYLLLNSDTIVRPGALSILLATAENCSRAGIVSPRLEWPDGTPQESCFRYLSPISELIAAARTGPITAALRNFVVPLPVSDVIIKPEWSSFACALLRNEMIQEIGPMDEGFFLYFEDVDYCRRARKAGWEIVHDPQARVVHLRGGSSPVKRRTLERKRLPAYYFASRSRYFYLAYGRLGLTFANLLWHFGRCVSKCREVVEKRERGTSEREWLDIWTNWHRPDAHWSDSAPT
jgi:GT2 family glycosyltransferase